MSPPAPAHPSPRQWAQRLFGPWVADVNRATLRDDLAAAPLATLLVLPQGIAFATLAGLPAAWGLYAAVVPALLASLFGSSRHMLTGPTNALAVALAASLAPLAAVGTPAYLTLALAVTLGVGLVQLAVALLRLGNLAHFISPAVLLGFTSGAAVLIAWHALRGWLGLPPGWPLVDAPLPVLPGEWLVGAVALVSALGFQRWRRTQAAGLPLLLGLGVGLAVALLLRLATPWPVSLVGALPSPWPPFAWPTVQAADIPRLGGIALALTLIALGQTMAVAKTLAARSGQPLDSNRECMAQGLANTVGPFFSAFVVCGSFNRSMPHQQAGARTPLAGVFVALGVLVLVALGAPLLALVPLAAVNALLLLVAVSLVDITQWREMLRLDRQEAWVAAGTFVAMLVLPIEVAVLAGVAASLTVYLHRSAHPAMRETGFDRPPVAGTAAAAQSASAAAAVAAAGERRMVVLAPGAPRCPQLTLLRMEGTVFFGAVPHVQAELQARREPQPEAPEPAPHLLVMAKSMNFIDVAGNALWEAERRQRLALGGDLYFHRPRPEVLRLWAASGFMDRLGADHVFPHKRAAIAAIVPRLDGERCRICTARVFEECARQPGGADAAGR
jgi:SulP family sulfate permease